MGKNFLLIRIAYWICFATAKYCFIFIFVAHLCRLTNKAIYLKKGDMVKQLICRPSAALALFLVSFGTIMPRITLDEQIAPKKSGKDQKPSKSQSFDHEGPKKQKKGAHLVYKPQPVRLDDDQLDDDQEAGNPYAYDPYFHHPEKAKSQGETPQKSNFDDKAFEKLQIAKINQLLQHVSDELVEAEQKLIDDVQEKIEGLSSYSKQGSADFIKFLDDRAVGYHYQLRLLQTIVVADYYAFLKEHDADFTYSSELSPTERSFISGVENVMQEALVRIQGLMLDLTSQHLQNKLGVEIAHGFYDSLVQAQRVYEQQKLINEQGLNRSWWDELKGEAKGVLGEFSAQFKVAVKAEVAKQVKIVIADVGGDIISAVGKKAADVVSDKISPALADKIEELGNKLKTTGLAFLIGDNSDASVVLLRKAIRAMHKVNAPTNPVVVRSSQDLCAEEKEFLKNRLPQVQKVLSDAFGISVPLRIAFCCSGGGNRAMVVTEAAFESAARHNFLQASLYCAGLSGSTWTIAPWSYLYLKGLITNKNYEQSLIALRTNFVNTLSDPTMIDPTDKGIFCPPLLGADVRAIFSNQLIERYGYGQHFSVVDLWGALIANYALKQASGKRLQVTWSELYDLAQKGDIPLPLCSAAFDARLTTGDDLVLKQEVGSLYDWFEMSPFESGGTTLGYILTQYLGSVFKDGVLVPELINPEYPMSFYLGLYGAAFSLTINDAVEKGLSTPTIDVFGHDVEIPVGDWIKKVLDENSQDDARSHRAGKIHAQFPNFSVGCKDSLLKNKEVLGMFDGGIAFNLPFPLLVERAERGIDVIIAIDSNPADVQTLKNADAYFKRKNVSMPTMGNMSKSDLLSRNMTVFNDPRTKATYNAKQPTVLYFPTHVDVSKPPFTTSNFKYSKDNIDTLVSNVDDAFESQVIPMKEILTLVANARYDDAGHKRS